MSYEDTTCPCGDQKPENTLLCPACLEFFKRRYELRVYQDPREPRYYRAKAACILRTLAQRRKEPVS